MDPIGETAHDGPTVWLVGEVDHPDFAEATALVRATADVIRVAEDRPPELILLVQSRPGVIVLREVERLRRRAPLAGIVALVGSWCEGETRTGRPAPGVPRLYWYDFSAWWRRQLALRAAGRCPDWARPATNEFAGKNTAGQASSGTRMTQAGVIALETSCWETAQALSDVLRGNGFDTIWLRPGRDDSSMPGAVAGIWEGGQLDDAEANRLAAFCARLTPPNAPVVALLDFPRRDRCERARQAGAAAVLGKPWLNTDLVATLNRLIGCGDELQSATTSRAA